MADNDYVPHPMFTTGNAGRPPGPRPTAPGIAPPRPVAWVLALGLSCAAGAACTFVNDGEPPPGDTLYFPTALALGRDDDGQGEARYLYIVNSNFDRRYNAGSLQSIDLDDLEAAVEDTCSGRNAGRECQLDPAEIIPDDRHEVLIDSMGRGAALSSDHRVLYIPTAIQSGLTFVRLAEDGSLECGQGSGRRCSDDAVAGDDPSESGRNLRSPGDPVDIIAGQFYDFVDDPDGAIPREYVLVAYREGDVALFVHTDTGDEGSASRPGLADVRRGLVDNLTGLAYDAATRYIYVTTSRSQVSQAKFLQRVGILGDPQNPLSSALYRSDVLNLDGVSQGPATWAAEFVAREPDPDGARRSTGFIVSQLPNSLLRVQMRQGLGSRVDVDRITSVGVGAARLAHGVLGDPEGEHVEIVVVSCFVERQSRIYIVNADDGEPISIVPGFSGSFEVQLDETRQRLYVADFSASVLRIVDLSPLMDGDEAYIQATLGFPKVVEELQ